MKKDKQVKGTETVRGEGRAEDHSEQRAQWYNGAWHSGGFGEDPEP